MSDILFKREILYGHRLLHISTCRRGCRRKKAQQKGTGGWRCRRQQLRHVIRNKGNQLRCHSSVSPSIQTTEELSRGQQINGQLHPSSRNNDVTDGRRLFNVSANTAAWIAETRCSAGDRWVKATMSRGYSIDGTGCYLSRSPRSGIIVPDRYLSTLSAPVDILQSPISFRGRVRLVRPSLLSTSLDSQPHATPWNM